MERLRRGAERLGIRLDSDQEVRFARYQALLLEWNQRVNLTRVVEYDAVQERHFLDSLSCLLAFGDLLAANPGLRLVDVGSGAGFPGLPLKIALPSLRLTLLDSLGKRTTFLRALTRDLGLEDVEVVTGRAEDVAHQPAYREQFDVAVARALAPLAVLLELALPFVPPGGRLVAPRKGDLEAELTTACPAAERLGGGAARLLPVELPGLADGRALVALDKLRPTPPQYPRRAGVPGRRPLGTGQIGA